jgi:hypothetical protein
MNLMDSDFFLVKDLLMLTLDVWVMKNMDILLKKLLKSHSNLLIIFRNKTEEFYQCAFKELRPMSYCRKYFDGIIRTLYRDPSNQMKWLFIL